MTVLQVYIGRKVGLAIAYTLLVLLVLLVLAAFIDEMADVGRGDFTIVHAFVVALVGAPRYAFEAFPIAALIGSLIALGNLATHSELTAMRAAGISTRMILLSVLKIGLWMVLILAVLGEVITPLAQDYANQMAANKKAGKVTLKSRYGFWAKDGDAFVNIQEIRPGNRLAGISFYELENNELRLVTTAAEAVYRNGTWMMGDILQLAVAAEKLEMRTLKQANWKSLLDPGLLDAVLTQPYELPAWDLYRSIQFMKTNGQDATPFEIVFWGKLATPLSSLVMMFLAIPVVFGNLRSITIGQRIVVGIMLGAGFFLLTRALSHSAAVFDLSPALTALLPAGMFLAGAIVLLRKIG